MLKTQLSDSYLKLISNLHPTGKAFDYQLNWIADTSKFKLAPKARQIGITTSEAIDKFLKCLLWKESEISPLPPVIIFCSPSQRQSNRLMDYVMRVRNRFENINQTVLKFRKESEDRLKFDNFSELWSLPNNPRTIEGIDCSDGIIDELGNFLGNDDEAVYQSLMGSLGAKQGGLTLFGKPMGRRGLFWKLYDPYGDYSKHYSIHKMDWRKRADEDKAYEKAVLEHKKRMSPLQFKQNYEAEFVDENVLVFPYELLDKQKADLKIYTLDDEYDSSLPVYMGIDFGRKISQSAVTCVQKDSKIVRTIFHDVSSDKLDKQTEWMIHAIRHFKPLIVNIDKTGQGNMLLDYLVTEFGEYEKGGLINGVHFNPGTKDKLVLNTKHLFETGDLQIPNSPDYNDLYEQIHGIEKTISETGTIKYSGKRTETDWLDDRAWSFFLSVYNLDDGQWNFTSIDTNISKPRQSTYEIWLKGEDV